jgi:hypothetical protein
MRLHGILDVPTEGMSDEGMAVLYYDPNSDRTGAAPSLSYSMALHPVTWLLGTFALGWAGGYLAWVAIGRYQAKTGRLSGLSGTGPDHAIMALQMAQELAESPTVQDAFFKGGMVSDNIFWALKDPSIPPRLQMALENVEQKVEELLFQWENRLMEETGKGPVNGLSGRKVRKRRR